MREGELYGDEATEFDGIRLGESESDVSAERMLV